MPPPEEVAPAARHIMRLADKAALATLVPETGSPFLSLVGVATLMDATPVLLMSDLSRHSTHLAGDDRASLLFDGTGNHANALTEERVSVNGRIVKCSDPAAEKRYMAKHPKAFYAQFADFSFYEMVVEDAHFVGGFGTALTIPGKVLRLHGDDHGDLLAGETALLDYLNEQQGEALAAIAVNLLRAPEGNWRATAIDPEGCDLAARKHRCRLSFSNPVTSIESARKALESQIKTAYQSEKTEGESGS